MECEDARHFPASSNPSGMVPRSSLEVERDELEAENVVLRSLVRWFAIRPASQPTLTPEQEALLASVVADRPQDGKRPMWPAKGHRGRCSENCLPHCRQDGGPVGGGMDA